MSEQKFAYIILMNDSPKGVVLESKERATELMYDLEEAHYFKHT